MGCETNSFCASLSSDLRRKLCSGCHRHLLSRGTIENFAEARKRAIMLVDGFIFGTSYGDAHPTNWPDVTLPRVSAILPGYLINYHGTFFKTDDIVFASSFLQCKTDSCIALFDQRFLDDLYDSSPEFKVAIANSLFDWTISLGELFAIAFAPTMRQKVELLLVYLERYRLYLSERNIGEMLACSRASVSRAFANIAESNPRLYHAYLANKARKIVLLNPE